LSSPKLRASEIFPRFAVRTGSPMCDKCNELDKKIEHYSQILLSIGDQITIERIKAMIGDLRAQKATLHPEQKQ
jgi:hypothetical protein